MIAKLAYLVTPDAGRYILNFQAFGSEELISIEVAPEQMRNILIDGTALMLRQSFHPVPSRVPLTTSQQGANERAGA